MICFSHLRWNFVFQRPQHLMTRYARTQRVYFIEEPMRDGGSDAHLHVECDRGVHVVTPRLPARWSRERAAQAQRALLDELIATEQVSKYLLWYYTPMALHISSHLRPVAIVYDCMDELSGFKDAAAELPALERLLMQRADLVLTGGYSLFKAKKGDHHNVHPLPSSVDVPHFGKARTTIEEPLEQRRLGCPRLGFFGVLDERLDIDLVAAVADARPTWQWVMLGPVVKIDPSTLPQRANIHYLGRKSYTELPDYIAGWDVALLPFARNDATRFISPTKTPEYLAAGKPVVSTSIADVVEPYGRLRLVRIADSPAAFVSACQHALDEAAAPRLARADRFLEDMSWDSTWNRSRELLTEILRTAPEPVRHRRSSAADGRPSSRAL